MAAALAGLYVLGGTKKAESNYITGTVKKGTVTTAISATGTVEPVSTVSLSFENAEIIKKIYVKEGDHVTAGQLLAEQESDNLEAQVIQSSASLKGALAKLELLKNGSTAEEIAQAEANVVMAQAAYDLTKTNLERYQALFQEGAVSRADLDSASNEYVNAEAKLKQAQESLKALLNGNRREDIEAQAAQVESSRAQLQIAQKALAGTKLFSPINGVVSEVNGGEGQRAAANNNSTSSGTGFIVVISDALQVRAQVNEADIGRLETGQKAEITVNAFPNKTFTGRVGSISPQATTVSNVQVYDTVIELDENQQGLKAGMPANVNIIVERREDVLTVARGAVTYAANYLNNAGQGTAAKTASPEGGNSNRTSVSGADGNSSSGIGAAGLAKENARKQQAVVLVLDKSGRPAPRQVVLGLSDLKNYEVIEGLNEGDVVIIGGSGTAVSGSASNNSSGSGGGPPLMGGPPPH
ncbi:membrane-fusion protein [Pelotomaculum thermopropionicum SI]|uniref:Membrane-fusion protein n=1 Tax=Pelotomaculum thermopropionicum (strain DSM 13744 / JCM 10971 / SI) TaxID=370438 RepID=A5D6C9_PELTS|nr:membrane-fusion protein [Pelotomaculum thermopropionicum SI]